MPIKQGDMDQEQQAAVTRAMMDALTEPWAGASGDDVDEPEIYPILTGEIRTSCHGSQWVIFPQGETGRVQCWRLMDVPYENPETEGGWVVMNDEGQPLGNDRRGLLILHRVRGKWIAQPIRGGGWNYQDEIFWTDAEAEAWARREEREYSTSLPARRDAID